VWAATVMVRGGPGGTPVPPTRHNRWAVYWSFGFGPGLGAGTRIGRLQIRQDTTCPRSRSSTSMYLRHCGFGHRTATTMRHPHDERPGTTVPGLERDRPTYFFPFTNFSGFSLNASRQPEQQT
jgi:hypothetical protein